MGDEDFMAAKKKTSLKAISGGSEAKSKATLPKAKKAFCKEAGCFENVQVKGFCRLHFLKALKAKQLKHEDDFENLKKVGHDRRNSNRLDLPDRPTTTDEAFLSRESERLSELDLDIEEFEVDTLTKKSG